MTKDDRDRLVCEGCGEHNRPFVKHLIEVIGDEVVCGVCGTKGAPERFMPWLARIAS
jgi:formylmethanofuran dehydrogenase subunit E